MSDEAPYMYGYGRMITYYNDGYKHYITDIWEGSIKNSYIRNGFGREIRSDGLTVGWWQNDLLLGKAIQIKNGALLNQGLYARAKRGQNPFNFYIVKSFKSGSV